MISASVLPTKEIGGYTAGRTATANLRGMWRCWRGGAQVSKYRCIVAMAILSDSSVDDRDLRRASLDDDPDCVAAWRVSHGQPAGPQLQVAILDAYRALEAVSSEVLGDLIKELPPPPSRNKQQNSMVSLVVASLLQLSVGTVRRTVAQLRKTGRPYEARRGHGRPASVASLAKRLESNEDTLMRLLRTAVRIGSSDRPLSDFTVDVLQQNHSCAAAMGQRYHSAGFCKTAISIAAEIIDELQADFHKAVLPSLGIPADLEITGDGVSIQKTKSCPWGHRSVVFIGTARTHHITGKTVAACLDVTNHGSDWRGPATSRLYMQKLAAAPFDLGSDELTARCAAFPGDGAYCKGGPSSQHNSSDVGGTIFRSLMRADRSVWDLMHRLHSAGKRVTDKAALLAEVFAVAKLLRNLIGFGQGLSVFEAVAECNGNANPHRVKAPVKGRILTGLAEVFENFIAVFPDAVAALMMRRLQKSEGRASVALCDLTSCIQRMTDPRLPLGALVMAGPFRTIIAPMMLVAQALDTPPWQKHGYVSLCLRRLGEVQHAVRGVLGLVKIFVWTIPYLSRADLDQAQSAFGCLLAESEVLQVARLGCSEARVASYALALNTAG